MSDVSNVRQQRADDADRCAMAQTNHDFRPKNVPDRRAEWILKHFEIQNLFGKTKYCLIYMSKFERLYQSHSGGKQQNSSEAENPATESDCVGTRDGLGENVEHQRHR